MSGQPLGVLNTEKMSDFRTPKRRQVTKPEVLAILNTWPQGAFRWGTADCCQFAGFIAYQLHGIDALTAFDYATEQEAGEYINAAGGLTGLLTEALKTDPVPLTELEPGDPALFHLKQYPEAVVVNLGGGELVGLNKNGYLIQVPARWCLYGWRLCPE